MISKEHFSEYGEDEWIDRNMELPAEGVYVDVGCGHPWRGSNTAFLRKAGWRGVVIDGNAEQLALWHRSDPRTAVVQAVISRHELVKFHRDGARSGVQVDGEEIIRARTLQSVLDEHGIEKLDYLSVDVEGYELEVLRSFDRARHAPSVIVAEYNTYGVGLNQDLLAGVPGYKEVHRTHANLILVREDL